MPHHQSLTRRLANLRSQYTNETHAIALSTVTLGVHRLADSERATLVAALRGDSAPVPARCRQAVLPDATHIEQQEVEAAILHAATTIVHLQPPGNAPRPARVFLGVRPAATHLVLHVDPLAVLPLLQAVLPRLVDTNETGINGVPGLRVWPHRRHLTLIQRDTPAQVHLTGITPAQWKHVLTTLNDSPGLVPPDASRLTGREHEALAQWSQTCGPTAIMSALLRRIGLFSHQPWLIATKTDGDVCYLGWPIHRTQPPITAALLHPITGIPAQVTEPGWTSDHHTIIPLTMPSTTASRAVLVLPAQTTAEINQPTAS